MCVPRFSQLPWNRFHPYARDSSSCVGPRPPNILPQILDDASVVEANAWEPMTNLSLSLMEGGHVGSFTATIGGQTFTENFDQKDLIQTLEIPLVFSYSVPHEGGGAVLTLNLTSGYASVMFQHSGGSAIVRWVMSM